MIRPGDVQLMSAGRGVAHSEFNHSADQPVHFLQIWIVPSMLGAEPRYQQRHFAPYEKRGRLRLIISPDGAEDSLQIRQNARVYAGLFDGDESASFRVEEGRYAYVHVARGELELDGRTLKEGDGVRIREAGELAFAHGKDAEVLVFDLRPLESPQMP